jgi:hypothetical protein
MWCRRIFTNGTQLIRNSWHQMFKFRRAAFYRDRCFKGMSIAFEYATARKWARGNPLKLRDKQRPTVGEMVPPPKKTDDF